MKMISRKINCENCGKEVISRNNNQRFCKECGDIHKKERIKTYMKKFNKQYGSTASQKCRIKIFELLGNQCSNPYNINHGNFLNDFRCLQIDHINGKGAIKHRNIPAPYTYYKTILNEIISGRKDYQLLCANCNWIKRIVNHECDKKLIKTYLMKKN